MVYKQNKPILLLSQAPIRKKELFNTTLAIGPFWLTWKEIRDSLRVRWHIDLDQNLSLTILIFKIYLAAKAISIPPV